MDKPHAPSPDRLDALLEALMDGTLDAEDRTELDAILCDDPAAAKRLVERVDLHAMLQWEHGQVEHETAESANERALLSDLFDQALEQRRLHEIEDEAQAQLLADLKAQKREQDLERRRAMMRRGADQRPRVIVIPKPLVWLGLAAAVLAIGLALLPVLRGGPDSTTVTGDEPGHTRPQRTPPPTVATLVAGDRAAWAGIAPPALNARLPAGPYTLRSGTARVVMDSGAVLMLKGPVTFDLETGLSTRLTDGLLVAQVPVEAHGFKVACPGFEVVDLGTEFAVSYHDHSAQLRVVRGEVEVGLGDEASAVPIHENQLVRIDADSSAIKPLAFDQADDIAWALPYAALLNSELVVNGDFEAGGIGVAHAANRVDDLAIPGWDNDGPATVIGYEQAGIEMDVGFPDPRTDPVPEDRGRGYYFARYTGIMTQTVDLTDLAVLADSGTARFVFGGDLGGYINQNDRVVVSATFFDEHGEPLDRVELEPVDARARGNRTGFIRRTRTGTLPAGTRGVRLEMRSIADIGGFLDGFADNISLVVIADSGLQEETP